MFTPLQRKMVAHAALVLLVGMLAGIGLLASLLGGIELIPGHITPLAIPGNTGAWVRAHVGGMLNAFFIIIVALIIPGLGFPARAANRLAWMLIGTGWANTLFYWAGLVSPNRAISFADNRWGPTSVVAIVGLTPALLFAGVAIVAVIMIFRQAISAPAAPAPSR